MLVCYWTWIFSPKSCSYHLTELLAHQLVVDLDSIYAVTPVCSFPGRYIFMGGREFCDQKNVFSNLMKLDHISKTDLEGVFFK